MKHLFLIFCLTLLASCSHTKSSTLGTSKLKVLIVDGQNNHTVWPKSTVMMKRYLEETGLFTVEVYRSKPTWKGNAHKSYYDMHSNAENVDLEKAKKDPDFQPIFKNYDAVISNFGWRAASWPKETQKNFEAYVANGGGFVTVHAANNSFPEWLAYNKIIGVGGWGNRNHKSGPWLYYDNDGKLIRNTEKGAAGTHGKQHDLQIIHRNKHPILAGLPNIWIHNKDECYGKLRGPAENLTILATAYCLSEKNGTGNHEPALMAIRYGEGRTFHTTLGHADYSLESVGFITTFQRGVEWAATGKVTQKVPSDFPTATQKAVRRFE